MKSINGFRKGFTFMELLVVIAVLAVLTAIVAAAVTGAKSTGTDGQVKSDAKATETALDNYNNKSIRTGQFPDTAITDTTTRYEDVVDVGNPTASGDNVVLVRSDGLGETLADKTIPSGETASDAVFVRRIIDFSATTNSWDGLFYQGGASRP